MKDSRKRCKRRLDGIVNQFRRTELESSWQDRALKCPSLRVAFVLSRLSCFSYKPSFGHSSTFKITDDSSTYTPIYLSISIENCVVVAFDSINKK